MKVNDRPAYDATLRHQAARLDQRSSSEESR
jgi:hypothetical protein